MRNFQQEIENVHKCNDWTKLLNYFEVENDKVKDLSGNKDGKINRKIWLIVHDIDAYTENCRLLGFRDKIYNAKNLKPKDIIIYYFFGRSMIKGIYEVCDKHWQRDSR